MPAQSPASNDAKLFVRTNSSQWAALRPRRTGRHVGTPDAIYARFASTDGHRIVYQCGVRIWCFGPATDSTTALAIQASGHRTQAARKFVSAEDNVQGVNLHPEGHSQRGKLFSMPLWEGAVRQNGSASGASNRLGQWLADGTTLVAVSDTGGDERILVIDSEGESLLPWDIGLVVSLCAAMAGTKIAISNHRNEVLIGDIGSGALTVADRSQARRDDRPRLASRRLAYYSSPASGRRPSNSSTLRAVRRRWSRNRSFVTGGLRSGGQIPLLPLGTHLRPVYDMVQFELSFPRAARLYLIALQCDGRPPFEPEPRGVKDKAFSVRRASITFCSNTTPSARAISRHCAS